PWLSRACNEILARLTPALARSLRWGRSAASGSGPAQSDVRQRSVSLRRGDDQDRVVAVRDQRTGVVETVPGDLRLVGRPDAVPAARAGGVVDVVAGRVRHSEWVQVTVAGWSTLVPPRVLMLGWLTAASMYSWLGRMFAKSLSVEPSHPHRVDDRV